MIFEEKKFEKKEIEEKLKKNIENQKDLKNESKEQQQQKPMIQKEVRLSKAISMRGNPSKEDVGGLLDLLDSDDELME